eukprot:scaffold259648_cov18-Tisochrysis_lutea.AAC.1
MQLAWVPRVMSAAPPRMRAKARFSERCHRRTLQWCRERRQHAFLYALDECKGIFEGTQYVTVLVVWSGSGVGRYCTAGTEAKEPVPTPSLEQGLSSSRGAWEKYKATRCDKKAPGPWPSWRAKGSTSQLAALVQQL